MALIYNILLSIYWLGVNIATIINKKARLFVSGRLGLFSKMKRLLNEKRGNHKIVWVHCASLGEFEQGRPIIEAIKKERLDCQIFLTFYSPSGFEVRKNYEGVDYVFYLPIDTYWNARKFVRLLQPSAVIFVKYEFWYHYLTELHKRNINTYLVSALFRKEQGFFKPVLSVFYRRMIRCFSTIFVQDQESVELLLNVGVKNVIYAGDTRFDRVVEIAKNPKKIPTIESFTEGHMVLVAGSTWGDDETLLVDLAKHNSELRMVIVPHEIHVHRIKELQTKLDRPSTCFSEIVGGKVDILNFQYIIVDSIGYLSSLYKLATYTYIGGGFGVGIHNTLEAAVYGKPVIFGPNYEKYREARDLVECGGAFSISSEGELEKVISRLSKDKEYYMNVCNASRNYVIQNTGTTAIIMNNIII